MKLLYQAINGLLALLFPPLCIGCKQGLVEGEDLICTICLSEFPETNYHLHIDNPVTERFTGKVAITYGFALYTLRKMSRLEQILFAMKYKNKPAIGRLLGQRYGTVLEKTALIQTIEGIIPLPLHKKRLKERGYNQSDFFAQGLTSVLNLPIYSNCVTRIRYTPSQTTKDKETRMKNLEGAFQVIDAAIIRGKHLLVVDDILTTGATLTACTRALLSAGANAVSVGTISIVD